jgi:hypothetical protein
MVLVGVLMTMNGLQTRNGNEMVTGIYWTIIVALTCCSIYYLKQTKTDIFPVVNIKGDNSIEVLKKVFMDKGKEFTGSFICIYLALFLASFFMWFHSNLITKQTFLLYATSIEPLISFSLSFFVVGMMFK